MSTITPESVISGRLDRLSDLLSPIVVKEVRQMVRGREFNYSFSLSLIAGLIVAFVAGTGVTSATGDAGVRIFSSLMACRCRMAPSSCPSSQLFTLPLFAPPCQMSTLPS